MNDFKNTLISPQSTILSALKIIDNGLMRIALVVDPEHKLLGTLSDGDVRRAILSGKDLNSPIESIYCRNPTTCLVGDSREKILQLAFSQKIYQVPVIDRDGCIAGIIELDELIKPVRHKNKVILMAGGLGSRLRPLTDETPKPMLQVGNKPILETIIENFSKYGYTDITICVNYKSHIIENYFGSGEDFGVNITYSHESKRMGTAGALGLMRKELTEPFFVMNGDLLTNINFEHMQDYHFSHQSDATMAVREYEFQVPYGVVNINDGKISSINEKPLHKFFVSAGIYMLSPKVLSFIPDNDFFDMPTLFQKLLSENMSTASFPLREYWLDIGKMSDYERANDDYRNLFI